MSHEFEEVWKEAILAFFGGTEGDHRKYQ